MRQVRDWCQTQTTVNDIHNEETLRWAIHKRPYLHEDSASQVGAARAPVDRVTTCNLFPTRPRPRLSLCVFGSVLWFVQANEKARTTAPARVKMGTGGKAATAKTSRQLATWWIRISLPSCIMTCGSSFKNKRV